MWDILPPVGIEIITFIGLFLAAAAFLRIIMESRRVASKRQAAAIAIRTILILLVVWILLNPVAVSYRAEKGRKNLLVLVDKSSSMSVKDTEKGSRFKTACNRLSNPNTFQPLYAKYNVIFNSFDTDVRTVAPESLLTEQCNGRGTDIEKAITHCIKNQDDASKIAGILLVSDGRSTQGDPLNSARLALADSIPVWTWCLGGPFEPRDISVRTAGDEMLVFGNDRVEIPVSVRETGYPNRIVKVELIHDNTVLDTREARPGPDGFSRVMFEVTAPPSGEHRYVFRVPQQPGEMDVKNNEHALFLRVVGQKVKVLLVEGQPHWDTKFLVQMLKHRQRVDLTAIYRLGPKRFSAIVSSAGKFKRKASNLFPQTKAELFDYDILILGRGCESFFSRETGQMLNDFVAERGGGIIFSRGKPYNGRFYPLAKLEPVVWGTGIDYNVQIRLTRAGDESPIFNFDSEKDIPLSRRLDQMPRLENAERTRGEKPLAITLATSGSGSPAGPYTMDTMDTITILAAYQRYGQGKAVTVNMAGMWRWAFNLQAGKSETDPYTTFWMSMLRWLLSDTDFMPGADISLRTARRYYTDTQRVNFQIMTRHIQPELYTPDLTITGPGLKQSVSPAKIGGMGYSATIGPLETGTYDVTLHNNIGSPDELKTQVEVVTSSIEMQNPSADPDAMHAIAETAGARLLKDSDITGFSEIIHKWHIRRQLSTQKDSMWNRWWILLGMMGLFGAEWYLRRREGLL